MQAESLGDGGQTIVNAATKTDKPVNRWRNSETERAIGERPMRALYSACQSILRNHYLRRRTTLSVEAVASIAGLCRPISATSTSSRPFATPAIPGPL